MRALPVCGGKVVTVQTYFHPPLFTCDNFITAFAEEEKNLFEIR